MFVRGPVGIISSPFPAGRSHSDKDSVALLREVVWEFTGEADAGSSLRGVLKGWFNHGVVLEQTWPKLSMDVEPDLTSPEITREARDRHLGAFYRINPFRLDDMQSAISELFAVAASGVIHDGWANPVEVTDPVTGEILRVIRGVAKRTDDRRPIARTCSGPRHHRACLLRWIYRLCRARRLGPA